MAAQVTNGQAKVKNRFSLVATGDTTTTSIEDPPTVVVVGMSQADVPEGVWDIEFISDVENDTNNAEVFAYLFSGGAQIVAQERPFRRGAGQGNTRGTTALKGSAINVGPGGATIEVRWRVSAGEGTMGNRTLAITRSQSEY